MAAEYQLEPHHVSLLDQAAKCLDRIEAARAILDKNGVVVLDRFGCPKQHPAMNVELQNKITFSRLLRELNLDTEAPTESRPPRIGGSRY